MAADARRQGARDLGQGLAGLDGELTQGIEVRNCDPFVGPLLYAILGQLLAYHRRRRQRHRCRPASQFGKKRADGVGAG